MKIHRAIRVNGIVRLPDIALKFFPSLVFHMTRGEYSFTTEIQVLVLATFALQMELDVVFLLMAPLFEIQGSRFSKEKLVLERTSRRPKAIQRKS